MNGFVLWAVVLLMGPGIATAEAPEGWFLAGNDPGSYTIGIDKAVGYKSKSSGRLASTQTSKGFGTMMQTFLPGENLGKRLRFTAWVKSAKVTEWAGLWMRVDGPDNKSVSFDNMQSRAIKGTSDWKQYAVVLDVPEESKSISFGILVSGQGTVWIDDIAFEVVDKSVPTTGSARGEKPKPTNLNFEK